MSNLQPIPLDSATRVLVVAPHPDDETLACGGLLQRAVATGATVRVLLLTGGDNNPWPQRWLERRWRIGPAGRERWARRRFGEAQAALQRLGVPGPALRSMAWPDLGLTDLLVHDRAAAEGRLHDELQAFAPTVVVLPALTDRHPDHSAAWLLLQTPLHRLGRDVMRLEYLIHGHGAAPTHGIQLGAAQLAGKHAALACHASQVALARRRLARCVTSVESYRAASNVPAETPTASLPWQVPRALRPLFRVLIHTDVDTRSLPMPPSGRVVDLVDVARAANGPAWFKLVACVPSPWIFDHWAWRRWSPPPSLDRDRASD